jgi:hypothetical protein
MKKLWEQLKPQERRGVTIIGVLLFLVLNYFLVWPQFKQWGANLRRMDKANADISKYQAELRRKPEYERRIRNFDAEVVPPEDQVIHFQNYIRDRATENGVSIQNESALRKIPTEFFLEQQETVQAVCSEPSLVNFLFSLGSSNSLMRVRNLILHPADLNRYQLHADVIIVASYQKNTPTPPPRVDAPARTEAPAAKPAGPGPKPMNVTNKPGIPNNKRP